MQPLPSDASKRVLRAYKNLVHHMFKRLCGVNWYAVRCVCFGFVQPQDECSLALTFAPVIIEAAVEPGFECCRVNF